MLLVFVVVAVIAMPLLYVGVQTSDQNSHEVLKQKALMLVLHITEMQSVHDPITTEEVSLIVGDDTNVEVTIDGDILVNLVRIESPNPISHSVASGNVRVHLEAADESLQQTVASIVVATAIVGGLGAILAWVLSRQLAKRFSATLTDFTSFAQRIGSGDTRPRSKTYDIEELDDVAQVLDTSARRIEQLLITERRLTSEVSHQLRTPLTALSLLIDEISEIADDPQAVRHEASRASAQIDRLNQTMSELMAARRGTAITGPGEPLSKVLQPVIADLHPTLVAQGRSMRTEIPEDVMADVPSGAVRHIASILLENAVLHGAGAVDLKVTNTGDWLILSVTDQGNGLTADAGEMLKALDQELVQEAEAKRTESIGLALAMTLAAAQGGRLEWRQSEPATLRVYLRSMNKNIPAIGEEAEDGSESNANNVG